MFLYVNSGAGLGAVMSCTSRSVSVFKGNDNTFGFLDRTYGVFQSFLRAQ